MRGAVFADTGFWIARLSPLDQLHAKARAISQSLNPGLVVTTELVLAETLNAYSANGPFVRGLTGTEADWRWDGTAGHLVRTS